MGRPVCCLFHIVKKVGITPQIRNNPNFNFYLVFMPEEGLEREAGIRFVYRMSLYRLAIS